MSHQPHSLQAQQVLESLRSSPRGLTAHEAESRLKEHGPNELRKQRRATALELLVNQFRSILVLLLVFAAFVSFLLGESLDAIVILAIVALNVILGFFQEYRAEKAIEALKKLAALRARVLRDEDQILIPSRDVVPGDLLL